MSSNLQNSFDLNTTDVGEYYRSVSPIACELRSLLSIADVKVAGTHLSSSPAMALKTLIGDNRSPRKPPPRDPNYLLGHQKVCLFSAQFRCGFENSPCDDAMFSWFERRSHCETY